MLRLLRLLLLCCLVVLSVVALEELEYDAQVAPPIAAARPVQQLWRSWVAQLHQILHRWQPTPQPQLQLRTTTPEPELKPYGALNPMFQLQDF
ncbi:hypothetical protein KR222_011049 [Zaprionus bogoriensis]|nr:hypothetical protein KR222_011049 [Zaprionus bogoriensis]